MHLSVQRLSFNSKLVKGQRLKALLQSVFKSKEVGEAVGCFSSW